MRKKTERNKTELEDLRHTVEILRGELHPELDPAFLAAVITAEDLNPEVEDQREALRQIQAALETALTGKGRR